MKCCVRVHRAYQLGLQTVALTRHWGALGHWPLAAWPGPCPRGQSREGEGGRWALRFSGAAAIGFGPIFSSFYPNTVAYANHW